MRRITLGIAAIFMLAALCFSPDISAEAPPTGKERVIYSFKGGNDGGFPLSDLAMDKNGNLYGTTGGGGYVKTCGTSGCGTVFELKNTSDGWKKETIYRFSGGVDGESPWAGLVLDADGNLYGTTVSGGTGGSGTVFKLTPVSGAEWKKNILYNFAGRNEGGAPNTDLVFDAAGNLYGAMLEGGGSNEDGCGVDDDECGAVFQLKRQANGVWTEKLIHAFSGTPDGAGAASPVMVDSEGHLFGTTKYGGVGGCGRYLAAVPGCGVVYELTLQPDGTWTETVLYSFIRGGGFSRFPSGELLSDRTGHLFGLSLRGGDGYGTVFELKDWPKKGWIESELHLFYRNPDGTYPLGRLVVDTKGDLFGVTEFGNANETGVAFELQPSEKGWHERILHSFGDGDDGRGLQSGLLVDAKGTLYGTTTGGGTGRCSGQYGCGTVYEIVP